MPAVAGGDGGRSRSRRELVRAGVDQVTRLLLEAEPEQLQVVKDWHDMLIGMDADGLAVTTASDLQVGWIRSLFSFFFSGFFSCFFCK
jgi:hypothetical protein